MEREIMDVDECAKYLGISPDTLYRYAADRLIPAFKLGNRWRFKRSMIDKWLNEKCDANMEGKE